MKLSAKNSERMNRLLGLTEDDLKKSAKQNMTAQGTSKQLDPAYVAASIADGHDWNEDIRTKKKLGQAYLIADAHDREENKYRQIADAISQHHDYAEDMTAEGRLKRAGEYASVLRGGLENGTLQDWEKNAISKSMREELTRLPQTAELYGQAGEWFDAKGIDRDTMELYENLYTAAHGNRVENALLGIGTSIKGNLAAIPESLAQETSDSIAYMQQYEGDYWKDFFTKPLNEQQAAREEAGYGDRPLDEDSYSRRMYNIGQMYKGAATGGLSEDGIGGTKYFSPKWLAEQGISIAENAPNLAISAVNPVLGIGYMVANAGGARALELAEQGVDTRSAVTRGLISGGIEAATEKFSIDNLLGAFTNNKGALVNILSQMGVEASEEAASYVLNYAADKAARDPNAQFSVDELIDSALGGAFSGGIYGAGGQVARSLGENSRKNYAQAKAQDAGRTADFDRQYDHYNKLGESGIEFDRIPELPSATPVAESVRQGAYFAGKNDGVKKATVLADKALAGETLTDAEIDSVLGHKETRQRFENAAGVKFSQSNAENRTTVRNYVEAEQKKPRLVKNDFSKEFGAETENVLDRLAKRGGAQIEIVESLADGSNAVYENGSIRVSAAKLREDREGTLRSAVMHELTHHIETSGKHYDALKKTVYRHLERIGADAGQLKAAIEQEYRAGGKELNADGAERELIAKYAEQVLSTEEAVQYLARENRGLFDTIREFIRDLVTRFKGTQDEQTMRKLLRTFDKALDHVDAKPGNRYQGVQNRIETLPDGRQYVKADRAVISGTDPSAWSGQAERFINEKIRNGEDVRFYTKDGFAIDVTERSAYKLTDVHVQSVSKVNRAALTDEEMAAKMRAAGHVDELIETARWRNWQSDKNNAHQNDIGEDGFDYFTTFFEDADGQYYRVVFSSGVNEDADTVYSIGVMDKRKHPTSTGSSNSPFGSGAQNGQMFSNNRISENAENGNSNSDQSSGQSSYGSSFSELMAQGDITTRYQTEVDAVLNGTSSNTDAMLVGYTPTVLRDLGIPSLPLVVGRGHVYTMAKTEAEARAENRYVRRANYHGLGDTVVKNLYQYISDPVMVIASKDVSNKFPVRSQRSVVAIIDIGYSDESMLIPVEITAERGVNGEQMDVNVISSVYTRGMQNLIEEAIAQENAGESGIFYIKNEAASKVAGRLQLPTQPTKATTSGIILHDVSEKVNLKIMDQTQTTQFTRWFGDWQNEPTDASKVVNEDGTPKVVYHGTNGDFNAFQSESGAYWFSESEDYAESMMEERGGNEIKAVYLNIRRPYRAKLKPGQFSDPSYEAPILRKARVGGYDGVIIENDTTNELEAETFYIVFKPEQIKSATDNVGTFDGANPDIRYSYGSSLDELMRQSGQVEAADRLRGMRKQYGTIERGERAARDVRLPKQTNDDTRVRRFARTAAEASVISDEQAGAIAEAVANGTFDYEPIGDQSAVERAEAKILRDAEQAKRDWAAVVNSNDRITKNDIALGELLLKQAAEAGDTQEVIRLTAEIAAAGTQAGQVVQAMRLLKQMGGAGQLAGIDQLTNQYQKDLDKRYGKKAPQLDIPDNLKQDLANAKTEAEIEQAKNAIFKHIASQIPSTWGDKWNAWRYLAMLCNTRTHIRNALGNAFFEPIVGVKNVLGAVIEASTDPVAKKVRGKGIERTKTLKPASRAVKSFSKADYAEMEEIVKNGGKYNDGQKIDDYRTIFTNKAIEWVRKKNGAALEKEDGLFLGRHYTRALASYITANDIDVAKLQDGSRESAKTLDKARAYAIREAQKATYRDASQTAELIAQTARHGKLPVRMVIEGVLPFKKTPINILKRGLEYSPAGLVKAVYKGVHGLKNGGYSANEFIDDLAAGLSGTALVALGYFMTSANLLIGGGDDEDESKWYKDMLGYQSYAIKLGDNTTYTIDWVAPGSMPLFVGVELFNLVNGGKLEAKDLLGAMELVTAPLNNMSMLSGLNDTLDNLDYGGDTDNALMNLFTDSVLSYLSQAVPTLGGQIARTMDGTRRTTYADSNNAMLDSWEKALQKAGNKIPYLSEKNPAYINLWGETEETENPLYRFVTNAFSPGYVDTIKVDALDEELLRLYEATGENVFPDSAGKSIRVGGETIKLTVDEFQTYAATLGKTSHEILYELAESRQYRKADDADKVAAVDMAYQYARALAKTEVSDYELDGWIAKAHDAAAVDLSPDDYILYKLACMRVDADQNDSITQEEAKNAIDSMEGLTKKQRAYLWQSQDKRWSDKKNPYK